MSRSRARALPGSVNQKPPASSKTRSFGPLSGCSAAVGVDDLDRAAVEVDGLDASRRRSRPAAGRAGSGRCARCQSKPPLLQIHTRPSGPQAAPLGPPPQLGHRRRSVPSGLHLGQRLAGDLDQQHAPVGQGDRPLGEHAAPRPPRSSRARPSVLPSVGAAGPASLNAPAGRSRLSNRLQTPGASAGGDRLGAHRRANLKDEQRARRPGHRPRRPAEASRMEGMEYRIEHDTMGEVRVPARARWGAQTQRAIENFPISGQPLDRRTHPGPGPDQGRGGPGQRQRSG